MNFLWTTCIFHTWKISITLSITAHDDELLAVTDPLTIFHRKSGNIVT